MLAGNNTKPQQAVDYFMSGYYQEGTSPRSGRGAGILELEGQVDNRETLFNIVNRLSYH
jgi:hypothetical protein